MVIAAVQLPTSKSAHTPKRSPAARNYLVVQRIEWCAAVVQVAAFRQVKRHGVVAVYGKTARRGSVCVV